MPYRKRALAVVVIAAIYLGAMFLATHLPIDVETSASGVDKLVHAAMYAGLAALLMAVANVLWRTGASMAVGVVLLAAIYGALDEWTQTLVPPRTADPWDWAADVAGASVGAIAYLAGKRIISGRGSAAD